MIDPNKIIEKYYPKDTDIFYILKIHSEQVREKALDIASKHPELNLDVQFLSEASLLHDIGIFKCYAPLIHCRGTHAYIEHGFLGAEILRNEGLPKHALVCERHTGTGLTIQSIESLNLALPKRNFIPVSLDEQVICYADKFFSKSDLTTMHSYEKITKELAKYGDEQVLKFAEWHEKFG